MAMRVKRVEIGFADATGFHSTGGRPAAKRKKKASGRKPRPKAHRARNPYRGHADAFDAGKAYRITGAHDTSGVANARVVRYGFLGWFNNQRPAAVMGQKAKLEREFREGYAAGKRIEAKASKGASKRNPIPVKWATAKVRKLGNDIQVMLFPKAAKRKVVKRRNPRSTVYTPSSKKGVGSKRQKLSKLRAKAQHAKARYLAAKHGGTGAWGRL